MGLNTEITKLQSRNEVLSSDDKNKISIGINLFSKVQSNSCLIVILVSVLIFCIAKKGDLMLFAGDSTNYKEFKQWIDLRFVGYFKFLTCSGILLYTMYFGVGGFQHWYYYVRQRESSEVWKCQAYSWLSPGMVAHEIMLGSANLLVTSAMMSAFACFAYNGGWSMIYFQINEYGWIWLILQIPTVFIYQEYSSYWNHRLFHTPWLYKHFHKLHHSYKQPTAFSVSAIHPVEFLYLQLVLLSPMFFIPTYWAVMCGLMVYTYYCGIIAHSGINIKPQWWQPWQTDSKFHDNHHQYFHVNFGFNMGVWDRIHRTRWRQDGIYREDVLVGLRCKN